MKWGATPFCFFSSDSASLDLSMSRKEKARSGRVTGYPEVMPPAQTFDDAGHKSACRFYTSSP